MATKSDFAQKLLHDLRLRKERMAAASQHPSNGSGSGSGSTTGSNGNPGPAYKGYEQTKTYESVGLKSGNSSTKPNGRSKSFQLEETSNHQLVPYMNGQSSGQTGNSSTAMELAFPNGVNLKKTDTKGRNPMLNFLQEIGKRSLGKGNIEIKSSFGKNSSSDSHVITFSEVHIGEISKGIQKLNQILKNCSKGVNLERYSTDVGRELLKGAIDLEQSLRMLTNVNEGSDYMIKTRRGKNTIKLVEDNKDNDDDGNKNDLKQVERPRFSFDKPNKNARKTKQGAKPLGLTYTEETQSISKPSIHSRSVSMDLDVEIERISSRPQPKNSRTSNVIAKLMGLEDLPRKDDSKVINSRSIESTASKREITFRDLQPQHTKKSEPLFNKTKDAIRSKTANPDGIFATKAEKIMSPDRGSSTVLITEDDTCVGSVTSSQEKLHHNASEAEHVSKSKHEKYSDVDNLQQQQKVRKFDAVEEKRNLQHQKKRSLIRETKGSQQEKLDKSKARTNLRASDKKQAYKKLDTSGKKMLVKQLEENTPKITFNKKHGLDSATGETDEMKISKHQIHRKADASVDINEIFLKPEPQSIVSEQMEQENDKKTRISGLTKQESGPLITEAISSQSGKPEMSSQTSKRTERSRKVAEDITYYNHIEEKDQSPGYSKPSTANANVKIINIAEEALEATNDFQSSQQSSVCADDIEMEPLKTSLPQHKGDHEIKAVANHVEENKQTRNSPSWSADQLTESEIQLKEKLIKNQLFLHTAEALLKLNIPVIMLHGGDHRGNLADNELILDCGIELLKKKGKRRQLSCYPFKSIDCAIMFQSFDGLIKQLNKDLCILKSYGGEWDEECDPSENIYQMLEKDVQYKDPDVNSMWDFGWYEETIASSEKDELIKEVEKHMLRKLLDELTRDLLDAVTN